MDRAERGAEVALDRTNLIRIMPTQGDGSMDVPRLHLVTPPTIDRQVVGVTQLALAGGAPLVQVRCKEVTDRHRYHHTRQLRELCAATGAMCLVNDRVDVALAVGADGVHVGDEDLPIAVARRLLGAGTVGATCRNAEAARRAVDGGANYLGVGPAYASATKSGLPEPLGPRGIEAVASAVDVPVIAIAGVTVARVPELLAAGAWGVAVVGAVYSASDPGVATAALLDAVGEPSRSTSGGVGS